MKLPKLIIHAKRHNFILAVRAAQWLLDHPEHASTVIEFEDKSQFYVCRNKSSITVRYQGMNTHAVANPEWVMESAS